MTTHQIYYRLSNLLDRYSKLSQMRRSFFKGTLVFATIPFSRKYKRIQKLIDITLDENDELMARLKVRSLFQ